MAGLIYNSQVNGCNSLLSGKESYGSQQLVDTCGLHGYAIEK